MSDDVPQIRKSAPKLNNVRAGPGGHSRVHAVRTMTRQHMEIIVRAALPEATDGVAGDEVGRLKIGQNQRAAVGKHKLMPMFPNSRCALDVDGAQSETKG